MESLPVPPYITTEIPGIGGRHTTRVEDFVVDELPVYLPSGEGDHLFVQIEKTDRNTLDVISAFAQALEFDEREAGYAGLKDRFAVTRQYISLPPGVSEDAVRRLAVPGVQVLSLARHSKKLKTGHLRGNQFRITLRGLTVSVGDAETYVQSVFAALARPPGAPNWFGPQRFGVNGDNAARGAELVKSGGRGQPRGRKRRLYISAYQSALFNSYLLQRIDSQKYRTALVGDVMKKTDSGGVFTCTNSDTDQPRLDHGEIIPTGPILGHRMTSPADGSESAALEDAVFAEHKVEPGDFKPLGKLAQGTRRPIAVSLGEPKVETDGRDAIVVSFSLPKGAYATTILAELVKG